MKNKNCTEDLKVIQFSHSSKLFMCHLRNIKNYNFYSTQVCKVVFNEKMTQFQERWQKVEKGKKEMKMNFIKYNNIVKVN